MESFVVLFGLFHLTSCFQGSSCCGVRISLVFKAEEHFTVCIYYILLNLIHEWTFGYSHPLAIKNNATVNMGAVIVNVLPYLLLCC